MIKTAIRNAKVVNEGQIWEGDILIGDDRIIRLGTFDVDPDQDIDLEGDYILPGVIDDQVHFREPGMTHKASISSESKAAVAGGITSFMEMPNTSPPALTQELLQEKYDIADQSSVANYSFYMGVSNDNYDEVMRTDGNLVCGLKIFMGSSTGNMLVDDEAQLTRIFKNSPLLIATHCEDETTVRQNEKFFRELYGDEIPFELHPEIRSRQACYLSSEFAVSLARKHGTRLHILHISTADELSLFENESALDDKKITSEVCVHHLTFDSNDYEEQGGWIKCNPAIKSPHDKEALWQALLDDRLDVVATDHAPHTISEKSNPYGLCPSGLPLVQHSLIQMLEFSREGKIPLVRVVDKMAHAPALCFKIRDRGFIREGYKADLVQIADKMPWRVQQDNVLYKCGWSPFEGRSFHHQVVRTWVNGQEVFSNGKITGRIPGERLSFSNNF